MTPMSHLPKPPFGPRPAACRALLLASVLASAGSAMAAGPEVGTLGEGSAPMLPVGDATRDLLALQRSGSMASATRRPIDGEVASRSYLRYLKSFEHPIPEKYGTAVHGSSAATPPK
jgi:hypothetical protein